MDHGVCCVRVRGGIQPGVWSVQCVTGVVYVNTSVMQS